jgi:dolichol-phosphate mannosyltransferase
MDAEFRSPWISVVMPALNERGNIAAALRNTLAAFDDFGLEGEVVVIDDGSTDGTGDVVRERMAEDPRIRIVRHESPRGVGGSFWDGVANARGEFVCMLPGDNENDPWELFRYHRLLEHVDILIPFVFNKQARSLFRNGLSFMYRFIINTTFLVSFNYTNGTILYRKAILDEIPFRSSGFFFQTDILIRAVKRGYLFAEVPYRLNQRLGGVSKAVSFPSFLNVVRGYVRLVKDMYLTRQPKPEPFDAASQTAKRYADGTPCGG